jgi:formylglycine-generating enzyme required for sulfatase activity
MGNYFNPPHSVTLTKSFLMGKYEVTQELFRAVTGIIFADFRAGCPQLCNWDYAIAFCNDLSVLEGLTPVYARGGTTNTATWVTFLLPEGNTANWNALTINSSANGYRLPTEAEWEYACRAGSTTWYNLGDTWDNAWGWYEGNTASWNRPRPVGITTPNAWGLYDMHGNVAEWVWDWYGTLGTSAVSDPTGPGPAPGSGRVLRGGGFGSHLPYFDLASESRENSSHYEGHSGFRVARTSL